MKNWNSTETYWIEVDILYAMYDKQLMLICYHVTYYNSFLSLVNMKEILDVSLNDLKFSLSNDIGRLTSLTRINLSGQPIGGGLPSHLDRLRSMETIDISLTQVSGPIFDFLPYWPKLVDLFLQGSSGITGTIPSTIAQSNPELQALQLEGTQIDAAILPTEIGLLTKLTAFYANVRSGSANAPIMIPAHLGNMTNLEHLWLRGFKRGFYGEIPTELGRLTNLISLHLQDGNLSGSIPSSIGNLSQLTAL
jgi:Leucine-rich repeat (LRR) protein